MAEKHFDPLKYLKNVLGCQVFLDQDSHVRLDYGPGLGIVAIMQAQSIADRYEALLSLQLHEHGASVQELACGGQVQLQGDAIEMCCILTGCAA